MYVRIEEAGKVLLSSKVAEKLANIPVQIRFNRDCTAIQIAETAEEEHCVTFPKNGRKTIPNTAEILKQNKIPLPAVFQGYICGETTKWRGEYQQNPIAKPSPITRGTKKK